jgi:mannose-6-phosphate isomerase-like protein (cupin superfamily)
MRDPEFPLTLVNPLTGETFELRDSVRGPSRAFRFRWTLAGKRTGPPEHTHPAGSESFTLVSGALDAWIDGARRSLVVGERVTIPPGTTHRFQNPGDAPAVVEVDSDCAALEDTIAGSARYFHGRTAMSPIDGLRALVHDTAHGASRFTSPVVRFVMHAVWLLGRLVGMTPFPVDERWAERP